MSEHKFDPEKIDWEAFGKGMRLLTERFVAAWNAFAVAMNAPYKKKSDYVLWPENGGESDG